MKNHLRACAAILAIAAAPSCVLGIAQAQTSTLTETHHYRYSQTGSSVTIDTNRYTGSSAAAGNSDSIYLFSTAGAPRAIGISITFDANGVFFTNAGTETLTLFDVTGNLNGLSGNNIANYTDASTGTAIGSQAYVGTNNTAMRAITIQLSQSFVDQYNATLGSADQRIALGAALTTSAGGTEGFWAQAAAASSFLTVTADPSVPEPGSWALMILGFGMVGGALRIQRRRTLLAA